jgi:hypothetical protein
VALSAERSRRYRARKRGVPVPRGRPDRKPKDDCFRAETPEQLVGQLLNIDPQRLRDLEAVVESRGLTLAQYVERQRRLPEYGKPRSAVATPRDPIVQELLDFRHRSSATSDETAITRGGPSLDFVHRSGVVSPYATEACTFCGKAASYRTAAGQPAHVVCERRAIRRAAAVE